MYNDWPYGLDEEIIHLVVWTKFDLEEDSATGDLTSKARKEINDYVNATFFRKVAPDRVSTYLQTRDVMLNFFLLKGDMVQELEVAEEHTRCGAFPCHAIWPGYGVC